MTIQRFVPHMRPCSFFLSKTLRLFIYMSFVANHPLSIVLFPSSDQDKVNCSSSTKSHGAHKQLPQTLHATTNLLHFNSKPQFSNTRTSLTSKPVQDARFTSPTMFLTNLPFYILKLSAKRQELFAKKGNSKVKQSTSHRHEIR